jgi:hypothetical protein
MLCKLCNDELGNRLVSQLQRVPVIVIVVHAPAAQPEASTPEYFRQARARQAHHVAMAEGSSDPSGIRALSRGELANALLMDSVGVLSVEARI